MRSAVTKESHALDCYSVQNIFWPFECSTDVNFKESMCHRDNTIYSPHFPLPGHRARWHFLVFYMTNLANGIKSNLNNRCDSYRSLFSATVTTDHLLRCQRIYTAPRISERPHRVECHLLQFHPSTRRNYVEWVRNKLFLY